MRYHYGNSIIFRILTSLQTTIISMQSLIIWPLITIHMATHNHSSFQTIYILLDRLQFWVLTRPRHISCNLALRLPCGRVFHRPEVSSHCIISCEGTKWRAIANRSATYIFELPIAPMHRGSCCCKLQEFVSLIDDFGLCSKCSSDICVAKKR